MDRHDRPPPPKGQPRRTLWDRIAYILAAILIWAAVFYSAFG